MRRIKRGGNGRLGLIVLISDFSGIQKKTRIETPSGLQEIHAFLLEIPFRHIQSLIRKDRRIFGMAHIEDRDPEQNNQNNKEEKT